MTWNTQDTNLSWYVPKANVDHTRSGQGTAVNTLDHSATTPRTMYMEPDYTRIWITDRLNIVAFITELALFYWNVLDHKMPCMTIM